MEFIVESLDALNKTVPELLKLKQKAMCLPLWSDGCRQNHTDQSNLSQTNGKR